MEQKEYIVYAKSDPFMNFGLYKNVDKACDERLKAEKYCEENANECREKAIKYPDMVDFFNQQTKKYEDAFCSMTVSTWEEYQSFMRERILDKAPKEVSKEEYNRQMDVLPPMNWCESNNVVMFCMSEFYWGPYTTQYAYDRATGKHWCKTVDAYDTSTWIVHNLRK